MKKRLLSMVSLMLSAMMICGGAVTAFAAEDDDDDEEELYFELTADMVMRSDYANPFTIANIPGGNGSGVYTVSLSELRQAGLGSSDLHAYRFNPDTQQPESRELSCSVSDGELRFSANGGDSVIITSGKLERLWVAQLFEEDDD